MSWATDNTVWIDWLSLQNAAISDALAIDRPVDKWITPQIFEDAKPMPNPIGGQRRIKVAAHE